MSARFVIVGIALLALPATAIAAQGEATTQPFTPTPGYIGATQGTGARAVLGSLPAPDMTHDAAGLWQKVTGTATPGANAATFTSIVKTTAVTGASAAGAYIEATDDAGGSGTFTEGLDARCLLRADTGTCGNVLFSATDAGIKRFGNLIGGESFLIDNTGVDQPVFARFDPNHQVTGFIASNGGPAKADAGFVVNGNNASPFRTGFLAVGNGVGSGIGVDDAGFASKGRLKTGLDLSASRFSGAAIASPGFVVGPEGQLSAGHVTAARFRSALATPTSSVAPCEAGDFMDDTRFHYVCVGSSHWRRVALSDF